VTPNDGLPDDMHRPFAARRDVRTLDEDTASRLLAGQLDPSDAPPGYGGVTKLLASVAAPTRPHELAAEGEARRVFRAVSERPPARRRRRVAPLVAALTAVLLVFGGGAAATATGSLPGSAQSVAHDALGAVGVSVPSPSRATHPIRVVRRAPLRTRPQHTVPRRPPNPPRHRPTLPAAAPTGPRSPPPRGGPNRSSLATMLCRADDAGRLGRGSGRSARAYDALAALAGGPGNIPAYCRSVLG
jgi:hypothetical protein